MCTFTLFISTILRSLEAEFDMICLEKYIILNQLRQFQCCYGLMWSCPKYEI